MKNSYGLLAEEWKVDLIVARAKQKGFRNGELEDVQQDIIQAVVDFEYDPKRSNGATESTALTALIDRQLMFIKRGRARRHKHDQKYRELNGIRDGEVLVEKHEPDHTRRLAMKSDVWDGFSRLMPIQQSICLGIMRDESRTQIAKSLGVSRYEVEKQIAHIEELFRLLNLDEWMQD